MWGSADTLHTESGRVSGCLLGSDPSSGTPYVPGCGSNPIAPHPEAVSKFYYGGGGNNIASPRQSSAPASILPVMSRLDAGAGDAAGAGITLAQSLYDTPIVAFAQATAAADAASNLPQGAEAPDNGHGTQRTSTNKRESRRRRLRPPSKEATSRSSRLRGRRSFQMS